MDISDIDLGNAALIDVRTETEHANGHISGSINIPLDEIFYKFDELQKMKKPLVFYCRSGARSQTAVDILKGQGMQNIYNGGGMDKLEKIID